MNDEGAFEHQILHDGGPRYFETNLSMPIAEPWNMASAALFVLIVAWWLYVLRGRFGKHLFLSIALPILAIGGIGGTLYHGFRVSKFFLVMDWVPILILTLMGCFHFTHIVTKRKWLAGLLILSVLIAHEAIHTYLRPSIANNLGYTLLGLTVLVPLTVVVMRSNGKYAVWVVLSLLAFCTALTFRIIDPEGVLPMGTHFLWHLFGAVACHSMLVYIFKLTRWRKRTGMLQV